MGRRKTALAPRECVECGRVFTPRVANQRCCSAECSHARDAEGNRRRLRKIRGLMRECEDTLRTVSEKVRVRAKRRPKGMSKVRWRIELRRRANAEYYDLMGSEVER